MSAISTPNDEDAAENEAQELALAAFGSAAARPPVVFRMHAGDMFPRWPAPAAQISPEAAAAEAVCSPAVSAASADASVVAASAAPEELAARAADGAVALPASDDSR